jgi:uncharacterized membrane protein YfhO
MFPIPLLADSLRCISSCLAFLFRSSVASSSLFYKKVSGLGLNLVKAVLGLAYPSNNLLYPLFVALHFEEGLDLADGQILPVPQSN